MKEDIFIKLIHFFKKENIEYCILGNVNEYPVKIGSDVDIVINSNQFRKVNLLVSQFLVSNNLEACNLLQHEIEGKYFVVSSVNDKECNLVMLALDFCANYMVNGNIVLTDKELLASKKLIRNNGVEFWVCSDEIAFIYYLYKKIIKQSISKNQFEYLHKLWIQNRNVIIEQFHSRFRLELCNKLIDVFDTGNETNLTPEFLKVLKKETQKSHKKNLKLAILEFKRRVFRFIKPTGVIIQILGNDETTKSDLTNLVIENAKDLEAFRSVSNLNFLKTNSMSNFKWLYFIYQYWFIVYPQKVRSKLVVLDSCFYKLFFDTTYYNQNSNFFFNRILSKIIPKPDLFFVVDSSFKISEQKISNKNILKSKKVIFIDTKRETKIIAFEIKKNIHNYLVSRYNEQ
ncbi:hypothetical protein ACFQZF_00730 [Flavobacterium myungsuense]|uniref:Uncharacterized protein n=1 Tax=Flavobacterium myungsuense TaxID=651823 RepID=A0ABW3J090_9FLAO